MAVCGRERENGSYFTTEMEPQIFVARPGVTSRYSIICTHLFGAAMYLGRRHHCHHQTISEIGVNVLLIYAPVYSRALGYEKNACK